MMADDVVIPPFENSIKSDSERPNYNTVAVVPQTQPEAKTMGSVPSGAVHSVAMKQMLGQVISRWVVVCLLINHKAGFEKCSCCNIHLLTRNHQP